jgi:hypothetical protein
LVVQSVNTSFTGTGDPLELLIDENPQSGYNDNQFMVDNFSVTGSSGSVPDGASTYAMFGLALAGLAGLKRYKALA